MAWFEQWIPAFAGMTAVGWDDEVLQGRGGPHLVITNHGVIPAKAGILGAGVSAGFCLSACPGDGPDGAAGVEWFEQWIPAFAGMTAVGGDGLGCSARSSWFDKLTMKNSGGSP
ncbi:MAG TPA: hypothetical protein PK286_13580 [Devosia sp.]|nr:hypothetical protein [Devosia sp.]